MQKSSGIDRFIQKTKSYQTQLRKVLLPLFESNPKESTYSELAGDKFKLQGQAMDQKKFDIVKSQFILRLQILQQQFFLFEHLFK